MPLPWRFNKRSIICKDNDTKRSSSNYTSNIETETQKPNNHEVKNSNCVQPKGIMFNYNIRKSVMKEKQYTTIKKSNTQEHVNNSHRIVDNVVPNKMYKIVLVDGKIMLAEHNGDDIVEEHTEDSSDSDVECITDIEANKSNKSNLKKDENTTEVKSVLSTLEHKINSQSEKPLPVTVAYQKFYSAVPKGLNPDSQRVPIKTYPGSTDLNESFVNKLASINGSNSSKNNMYATGQDLADARKGKAMVLLPLQKYTSLKKKLTDMQKEEEKWLALEKEYKREKVEAVSKASKMKTIAVQTSNCHKKELEELNNLKDRLASIFTEAQINMICNTKKMRDIKWSDSEMEKVAFLKQIISQTAYVFLKYKMHFPLPGLSAVRQWMIEKNIYVKPKRKEKIKKSSETTMNVVGERVNLETAQDTLPLQSLPPNVLDESRNVNTMQSQNAMSDIHTMQGQNAVLDTHTMQGQNALLDTHTMQGQNAVSDTPTMQAQNAISETAQAVNTILGVQQHQDMGFGNTIQVHHTLSVPADTGEQFVYYTYENDVSDHDVNDTDYIPENIASVEEVVHSKVVKPRRKVMVDPKLRCRLCMRPFDTQEEVREHVPMHYYNTICTSYLDAVKPFVCDFCNEAVKHRFDLVHHHRVHLGIDSFKCWYPGCTYVGKNVDNLKSHHDRHNAASFKCEECGALFKTHKYMRQHRERRHSARATRRCQLCGATCLTLFTYRQHLLAHARPPRVKCVEAACAERFYSRTAMRAHAQAQHRAGLLRPHRCPHCPLAAYVNHSQLAKHLQKHETHKVSHCIKCLKVFYDYGEFYTHCMEHKQSDTKYKCGCGERFTAKEQLGEHKSQCTFVRDNKKSKAKRKRKNEGNTEGTTPKRRKTKNVQDSPLIETNVVIPEKKTENNINTEGQEHKEVSEVEQDQQRPAEAIATQDVQDKVITLQVQRDRKRGLITFANNYPPAVTSDHTQQIVTTTENELQKYIMIPKHHQKSDNHQQSDNNQGKVSVDNHEQNVIADDHQQQSIVTSDDQTQKFISVPDLIVMPNLQQDVTDMSVNVSQNVTSVSDNATSHHQTNQQNVVIVSNEKLPIHMSTDQQQPKNTVSVNKGHNPKKLRAIPKGSPLEKMIAMSTRDKIVTSSEGNYIKKVLTLPVGSPLRKVMTDPEIPVKHNTTPENPLQTKPENKIKQINDENNTKIDNAIPTGNPVKKIKAIGQTESTTALNSNKLITQIPETKKQQKIISISREQLALLASKHKKLIAISKAGDAGQEANQMGTSTQDGTPQPDMPIIELM